jgi:outer membrane protein TolC
MKLLPFATSLTTALMLVNCSVSAQEGAPVALDYGAAWQQVLLRSERLAAARSATESKAQRVEGLRRFGGPSVSLSGAWAAYHAALTVDLSSVNDKLSEFDQQLPVPLENLPIPLPVPQLPPRYTYSRDDHIGTASVSAVAPLYLGGAADAVRGFADAQQAEARADERQTEDQLATLLSQRYFGAQLARRAAALRAQALATVEQHDRAADKLLANGAIARVERLQASAALEDARRNARKAASDAELAERALASTVGSAQAVAPSSPLFVQSAPLPPLNEFIDQALLSHPGLAKVEAKKAQAERLHEAGAGLRQPQVFAFAQRELRSGDQANWVAGIGARWTLYTSLDRGALDASTHAQVEQARHSDAQARADIALLVERQWRAAEQARQAYLSMGTSVALAEEIVHLRAVGLREGTSTPLERIEADTNLAKVQTERAQIAFDYVTALAGLYEACGQPERFAQALARADIRITP